MDDLISRQAVLEIVEREQFKGDAISEIEKLPSVKPQEQKYCDRNICMANEYNGIGCDECEVTKSQEPTDENLHREREQAYMQGYEDASERFRHMPSVAIPSAEPKWIPVSERLPEDGERVLVTYDKIVIRATWDLMRYSFYDTHAVSLDKDFVYAWMPLPKPYELQEKRCVDCNHYGKFSLDCDRCDDDCSMYEPQKRSEE